MFKQFLQVIVLALFVCLCAVSCSENTEASSDSIEKESTSTLAVAETPEANNSPELITVDGPGVLERVRASKGKAVLVNIWATWCPPCLKKFPSVLKLREEYADEGLDVVFVSADFEDMADKAQEFLAEQGVDFATYLKTGKDHEFIDAFESEWTGALPVMFLYNAERSLVKTWNEATEHEEVQQAIEEVLSAQ